MTREKETIAFMNGKMEPKPFVVFKTTFLPEENLYFPIRARFSLILVRGVRESDCYIYFIYYIKSKLRELLSDSSISRVRNKSIEIDKKNKMESFQIFWHGFILILLHFFLFFNLNLNLLLFVSIFQFQSFP